jgi:hypothetical protein
MCMTARIGRVGLAALVLSGGHRLGAPGPAAGREPRADPGACLE